MAQDASSSKRARTAEDEAEDYEGGEEGEGDESGEQDGSFVDSLMAQISDHKAVLAPVATSAVAAAATYAAKKLPDLIDQLEGEGGDKLRGRLSDASDSGGVKGFAAGAASRAFDTGGGGNFIQRLRQGGEDEAKEEAKDSGGVTGMMAKVSDKLGGRSQGGNGWGRGRRLPIQVAADVAAPIDVVYGQYTQFEDLNTFMHRVENVEQEEPESLVWHENIWGRRRDWKVQITEQVPNERIAWELKGGGQGTGVITFHELAPKLTRIELVFDWQPKGFVEKIGSGLRVQNRAAKTDLRRFKAFVETRGEETGTWPGRIEDGEAKGRTRNKRNSDSDPVPTDARQHSEEDEKKASGESEDKPKRSRSGSGNGSGDDESGREAAREERKRQRTQRSRQRKQAA